MKHWYVDTKRSIVWFAIRGPRKDAHSGANPGCRKARMSVITHTWYGKSTGVTMPIILYFSTLSRFCSPCSVFSRFIMTQFALTMAALVATRTMYANTYPWSICSRILTVLAQLVCLCATGDSADAPPHPTLLGAALASK